MKRIDRIANWLEPIFRDNLWHWHLDGIPNKWIIAETLKSLKKSAKEHEQAATGRLMAQNADGRIEYYLHLGI